MNDKDKQEFQNFINRHDFNRDIEAYSLWQAACQYKKKQIDKQEKDIIQLAEKNEHYLNSLLKLEKENEELKYCLKLANTIIDELIEVAEVHVDDTFEKINELNKLQGK